MLKQITDFLLFLYVFSIPIMKVPRLPVFEQKLQYSQVIFLSFFFIFLLIIKIQTKKNAF